MARRIDPRVPSIISALIGGIAVWLGYAYGGELCSRPLWIIVFVVYLIASIFREWWAAGQLSVEPLKELKQELIELCANSTESFIKAMREGPLDHTIRAYMMKYDQKGNKLFIETYSSNMGNFREEIKRFRPAPGQGIQGIAFSANGLQFSRYDPTAPLTDPRRSWGLMELRELIPPDINWCWAFPLDKDGSPFGVLYVDTTADLTDEQAERVASILRGYANMLSRTELAI